MSTEMCTHCHIGRMHSTKTTFLQPLGDQMLIFPNAPAAVCDVCGQVQFDALFTDIMAALISSHLENDQHAALSRGWAVGEQYASSQRNRIM